MAHQHILGYLVPYNGEKKDKNVKTQSRLFSYDKCEVTKRTVENKKSAVDNQEISDANRRKTHKNKEHKGVSAHCGYGYGDADDPHIEDDWCQSAITGSMRCAVFPVVWLSSK